MGASGGGSDFRDAEVTRFGAGLNCRFLRRARNQLLSEKRCRGEVFRRYLPSGERDLPLPPLRLVAAAIAYFPEGWTAMDWQFGGVVSVWAGSVLPGGKRATRPVPGCPLTAMSVAPWGCDWRSRTKPSFPVLIFQPSPIEPSDADTGMMRGSASTKPPEAGLLPAARICFPSLVNWRKRMPPTSCMRERRNISST